MHKFNYTTPFVQHIQEDKTLIKLWAQGKISYKQILPQQINIIKKFCLTDINWNVLTGSK